MTLLFLSLAALSFGLPTMAEHFYFDWPVSTAQCEVINLTWQNATAPFTAFVVPMGGQPFIYHIPDSAYSNATRSGSYDILLQIGQGSYYVVFLSDASGIGSGGSSEVQAVASSNSTSCLNTAAQNSTARDFSFDVSGTAAQCASGFELNWTGLTVDGPYNFTVIPLDQGLFPYDVLLDTELSYESDWTMNMTGGTRFTVMMNSKNGYGRGGVAGIYEVQDSRFNGCQLQQTQTTGQWPAGLATNTLPLGIVPVTAAASTGGKSLTGGKIAGIVVGAVVGFALLVGALLFCLFRRRKRRAAKTEEEKPDNQIDLAEEEERDPQLLAALSPFTGPEGSPETNVDGPEYPYPPSNSYARLSTSTAGFAGLGAIVTSGAHEDSPRSPSMVAPSPSTSYDDHARYPSHGIAGPLPVKGVPPRITTSVNRSSTNMRVTNVDGSESVQNGSPRSGLGPRPPRRSDGEGMTYRRHEDAGRVAEVVDLPPLYTDVPTQDGSELGSPEER